jgi:hypothetical protein
MGIGGNPDSTLDIGTKHFDWTACISLYVMLRRTETTIPHMPPRLPCAQVLSQIALETLDVIGPEVGDQFLRVRGHEFHGVPYLKDSPMRIKRSEKSQQGVGKLD